MTEEVWSKYITVESPYEEEGVVSESKKKIILYLSAAVFLFFCMISLTFYLIHYIRESLEEDAKRSLMEMVEKDAGIVSREIMMDLHNLNIVGELIVNEYDDFDDPQIPDFLNRKCKEYQYNNLILSNTEGVAQTESGEWLDLSKRLYFKTTMQGIENISEQLVSRIDGENIYISSVPLYQAGSLVGSLHGIYSAKDFESLFNLKLFEYNGYINIINQSGEIIVRTASNQLMIVNNNYYRELQLLGNNLQAEKIKNGLDQNSRGFADLNINNKTYFAAYTPIENVYGWNLVAAVPKEVISKNANNVMMVFLILFFLFIFTAAGGFIMMIVQNHLRRKVLEEMAFVDPVTGGNTMNKFLMEAQALLSKKNIDDYIVIIIEIDNFKYINSLYSYEYSDNIFRGMYRSLERILKEKELLCHGHGDHFAALLYNEGEQELEKRITRAIAPLSAQLGATLQLSCGACLLSDGENDIKIAIENAESAAKTIKNNPIQTLILFTNKMGITTKEEEEIKQCMKKALINKEFEAFYQPKVNIEESEINGAEVLVRWRHPKKGLIPPDRFVPVIEKTGFIVEVDLYMFECACQKLRTYLDSGIKPIPISVNFSRIHFFCNDFISRIRELSEKYKIPTQYIEIEITETAVFDNLEQTKSLISGLKTQGFLLSMDDFGSGYSSFNVLKDLPIDILKIDKEFFSESEENGKREIVISSIVEMAKKLDIRVIAEGVETLEQVEMLKRIQCTTAQGYYYSKPITSEEFDKLYLMNKKGCGDGN